MSNKRSIIYLVAVLILAAVIFWVEKPESSRIKTASKSDFIPDYDTADIASFEVDQFLEGARLKREGEKWLVTDFTTPAEKELLEKEGKEIPSEKWYRADRPRVMSAIGIFSNLEEGALVSDNPEKRSLYQVDAAGVHAKGLDSTGKVIFDVVIGKNGPDFASAYIRRLNEDKVYLVHQPIVGQFSPRVNDWRDRKLWSVEPSSIKEISVESPKGSWKMKKTEAEEWELSEPKGAKFDSKKAKELANKLSRVNAKDFADNVDGETDGLGAPSAVVKIKHGENEEINMKVGRQVPQSAAYGNTKGHFSVQIGGSDEYYLVSPEVIDTLPFEPPH